MANEFVYSDLDNRNLGAKNYNTILSNINRWKRSNGRTDEKRLFTDPVDFFFKPFFYFDSTTGDTDASRLLGLDVDFATLSNQFVGDPSFTMEGLGFGKGVLHTGKTVNMGGSQDTGETGNQIANSAINFLLQNRELERAEKLLQFIQLLSDISTYEPWTFQQISGLDEALNRKFFTDGQFKLDEERKSITIKCLPESYHSRIGTLMDLYRDVCFSYKWKKEIVPSNLRKFDMGIYIFSQPVRRFHKDHGYASFEVPKTNYQASPVKDGQYHTSVKYIELLNCEFDYNSNIKSYADLDDAEGKQMECELKIYFDDAYEVRYDEFIMRTIGDMVFQDDDFLCQNGYFQVDGNDRTSRLKNRTRTTDTIPIPDDPEGVTIGLLDGVIDRAASYANSYVNSKISSVEKKVLGNLSKFNLEREVKKLEKMIPGSLPKKLPNSTPPENKRGFTRTSLRE